ncbi:MAG: hypothetical protein IPG56_06455 [Caulobacteraceae bacterium]|nr:hypothetical protein [Caulobacteraceae bacterium]
MKAPVPIPNRKRAGEIPDAPGHAVGLANLRTVRSTGALLDGSAPFTELAH